MGGGGREVTHGKVELLWGRGGWREEGRGVTQEEVWKLFWGRGIGERWGGGYR